MGKTRRLARLCGVGDAIGRRVGAALAGAALAGASFSASDAGSSGSGNWGEEAGNAALEEAFFETLWRCESPLLVERNAAEDALFERFAEFEPIWQDRRFLTNGEIGAEARQRFELVEARRREEAFDDCVAAFKATFETVASASEGETRDGERENDGGNEEKGEDGRNRGNSKDGETARGRARLRWGEKPLRIVYLSPDWSAFERRDGAGNLWRPSGRFSAPEPAPEFDATELTFETTWKRVDGEETALKGKDGENAENSEGETTVVGVLQGLIGGDFRVWTLPLRDVASENGGIGEEGEDKKGERGEQAEKKRETAASVVDFPGAFQSGDAVATVGETTINANGETTARVRFDFAEAFDAFDSHRVWCDERDFALIVEPCGDEADAARAENATRTRGEENGIIGIIEKKSAVAINGKVEAGEERTTARLPEIARATAITEASGAVETGAVGPRWEPIRWRVRERSANGALFELDFPDDAALREAVAQGRARLACRIPRFFFWTRIEIGGIETRLDGGEVGEDEETAAKGAVKGEND